MLIAIGLLLLLVGLLWPWLSQGSWWKWIGRLPGDIRIEREGFGFYFPIVTMIVVSAIISGVLWVLRRL
ncbi:MAG: DUF2905 domain-containing protein [Flavobacteriales bacterium]